VFGVFGVFLRQLFAKIFTSKGEMDAVSGFFCPFMRTFLLIFFADSHKTPIFAPDQASF
jgi:hypothetical protein